MCMFLRVLPLRDSLWSGVSARGPCRGKALSQTLHSTNTARRLQRRKREAHGEIQEERINLMLHKVAEGDIAGVGMNIDLVIGMCAVVIIHDSLSQVA